MSENVLSTATKMNEIRFIFSKYMNKLTSKNKSLLYESDSKYGIFAPVILQNYEIFVKETIDKIKSESIEIIEELMLEFIENEKCDLRYSTSPQQRTKRFSKDTLEILEDSFLVNEYPNDEEKYRIAKRCRITSKQVSNWFTNKRNRTKNIHKNTF